MRERARWMANARSLARKTITRIVVGSLTRRALLAPPPLLPPPLPLLLVRESSIAAKKASTRGNPSALPFALGRRSHQALVTTLNARASRSASQPASEKRASERERGREGKKSVALTL